MASANLTASADAHTSTIEAPNAKVTSLGAQTFIRFADLPVELRDLVVLVAGTTAEKERLSIKEVMDRKLRNHSDLICIPQVIVLSETEFICSRPPWS